MRYYIDFYDMCDGWTDADSRNPSRMFDNLESAKKECQRLQSELRKSNAMAGEHYGVFDTLLGREIYCGRVWG